jgi:hypothetical protein
MLVSLRRLWRACAVWPALLARLSRLPSRQSAVVLSAYASLVHDWVLPQHYQEWWGYGLFFLLAAALQAFYAGLLLLWPGRWVYLVGIAANGALLSLYAVTRTLGVPLLGPHAGLVESVGVPDLASAAAEVALVCVLVRLCHAAPRERPVLDFSAPPLHRRTHATTLDILQARRDQVERAGHRVSAPADRPTQVGPGRRPELEPTGPAVPAAVAQPKPGNTGRHHHGNDALGGAQAG